MYRNTFRFLITPVLALSVLRAVLKLLFIDTVTGFYSGGGVLPLIYTVLTAAAIVGAGALIWRENDPGALSFKGNASLEIVGIALGIAIVAVNGFELLGLISKPFAVMEVNVMPRPLRLICYLSGVVSGGLLAWIASTSLSGMRGNYRAGYAALVISVWHSLYMITRFISFRQASTVSDQFIDTLYMLSATFFWLAHSRCIADVKIQRKRIIFFSAAAVILGIPLAVGQLFATFVLGSVSGPSFAEASLQLVSCVYFFVFAMASASSPTASSEEL